jgi:ATP-binding cassette subfamily C protein
MRSSDSWTEGSRDVLRAFAATLDRAQRAWMAAYVLASLLAATAGSLAALLLVPLIQPAAMLPVGGMMLDMDRGLGGNVAAFAAAMGVFALLRWSAACLGARLAAAHGMHLRNAVHARLVDARMEAVAGATSAEIANVLTYNVDVIVHGFGAMLQLLVALVTTVVTLAVAAWVSPLVLLALPLFAAFAWLAARLFGGEQGRIGRDYVAGMSQLFWRGEDFPRRLRHVRSFGQARAEHDAWSGMASRLGRGYRRQLELAAHGRLLLELLAAAAIAGGLFLAHRWQGIEQATLVAVCLLLGRLLPYLASTRQGIQQLRSAVPAFALWRRYVALPPAPAGSGGAARWTHGAFRIHRLQLPPALLPLEVRDLALVPGEILLVQGDSGIGKSCLVDVLAALSEPAAFEAELHGQRVGFDGYRDLVARGAYVSQQVRPWHATVRDCLLWAAPGSAAPALWRAIADVGLDRRLERSPAGLDTALQAADSRFSGGELQRLLLAQVLLREPVLAILDEATSALDAAAETAILATLRRRLRDTAIVVVSHRGALAAMADQCLVVDGGGVAFPQRQERAVARSATGISPGRRLGTTP